MLPALVRYVECKCLLGGVTTSQGVDPMKKIDELRKLANTDYFDICLLHFQHFADWPTASLRWQDGVSEAQHREIVRVRGASVHGLPALRQVPGEKWLQVGMIRMNSDRCTHD